MTMVNPEIQDMIMQKKLSNRKIRNLIVLKKMIDRLSTLPYVSDAEVKQIEEKYGVKPDILSWGDYFQTEVATNHWEKSDADFENIIQTITFDIIAAILIFSGKDESFIGDITAAQLRSQEKNAAEWNGEDEENMHLGILLNYFRKMGLDINLLNGQDFSYFEQFASQKAVG